MMEHLSKQGQCKLVETCGYPLTGIACVNRVYTDLAVIDLRDGELLVRECVPGLDFDELQRLTPVALIDARQGETQ